MERIPLTKAMSATKAINIAATLSARCIPSDAPRLAASMRLESVRSILILVVVAVTGISVSGIMIFEIAKAAGALITLAVNRWPAILGT